MCEMSILQFFKKQRECLGHFQSPARMKALLPLLDSAIYFYTRDNHAKVNLDTAMPHAVINYFPNTCTYAIACKNTNTSECASFKIIICCRKRLVSLFVKFFFRQCFAMTLFAKVFYRQSFLLYGTDFPIDKLFKCVRLN